MKWWLVIAIFVVFENSALEDFDEVVVKYPKLKISWIGEVSYETNNTNSGHESASNIELSLELEDSEEDLPLYNESSNLSWINSRKDLKNSTDNVETFNVNNTYETHLGLKRKKCPSCKCGVSFKNNRIVGGMIAKINEYPWMVYLTEFNKYFCGASVLNTKYLLTAAHCVSGIARFGLRAIFLDYDRATSKESNQFSRKIASIMRHHGYSASTQNNDIAVLKLDREVTFTGILRPVCLPAAGKTFAGANGIVTGWGTVKENGQTSQKLREVTVPILSNAQCKRTGNGNRITDNMMCAGYTTGKKDSCQGDSGGPLHVKSNNILSVAGVVSWGDGCARPNHPGVYTRVSRYLAWIRSNTKEGCYCTSK